MKIKQMEVTVQNVTEGKSKYVVARLVEGKLWYYGRFKTEGEAEKCAGEFDNGLVLEDITAKEPRAEIKCPECGRSLTDFDLFMRYCPLCMKTLGDNE